MFNKIFGKKKDNLMDCEICFKFAENKLQVMFVEGSVIAVLCALATLMQDCLLLCCDSREQAVSELKRWEGMVVEKLDERLGKAK